MTRWTEGLCCMINPHYTCIHCAFKMCFICYAVYINECINTKQYVEDVWKDRAICPRCNKMG